MRDFPIGHIKKAHPHAWLWEPLENDPTFFLRPMFGGRAVYAGGRLALFFLARPDECWRGVYVCVERGHHAALMDEFPELAPHSVLSKWLYLPENHNRFEAVASRLVELARRRDPRIGVIPPVKRKKSRARGAAALDCGSPLPLSRGGGAPPAQTEGRRPCRP
ncbi:MAG: hypothetical protein LBM92_08655 [Opitutaceae bacterium]|jgi:hypothetical protein|nr:hypothetical protein [Opitutaceae bacterium]